MDSFSEAILELVYFPPFLFPEIISIRIPKLCQRLYSLRTPGFYIVGILIILTKSRTQKLFLEYFFSEGHSLKQIVF